MPVRSLAVTEDLQPTANELDALVARFETTGVIDEAVLAKLLESRPRANAWIAAFKRRIVELLRARSDADRESDARVEALAAQIELEKRALKALHERYSDAIRANGAPMPCLKVRAKPKPNDEDDD